MNPDTQSNILSIALEAKQLELERARMQLEDQQTMIIRATENLTEEISFIQVTLQGSPDRMQYQAACDALEILWPGDPDNYN